MLLLRGLSCEPREMVSILCPHSLWHKVLESGSCALEHSLWRFLRTTASDDCCRACERVDTLLYALLLLARVNLVFVARLFKHRFSNTLFASSESPEPLVHGEVHRSIVALKVHVVKLMEVVTRPWPLEPVVSQPRPHRAVNDAPEEDGGVATEWHADEGCAVVHNRLKKKREGATRQGER
jgi:hypothetical protein